ncbi:rhomboid family protein [Pseudotamlana agarivorans]|uniref:rhomboid family protein n=1 Tax=Pseudotamlana agarivorans TaxID=481183 RepID=UPI000829FC81|nr:rhomboid family intramembrane serine protease [Tamlana agarivorans]
MNTLVDDIKYKLSNLNVLEKIIAINVVVFVLSLLLKPFLVWFELPSQFFEFIAVPWTIMTYAFLHYDFIHLLFNMLWLYFLGRMFLNLFNPKLALNVYFLGAISGGFLFVVCYSLLPTVFKGNPTLVGASGAVRALLIFLCAYMPKQEVRLFVFNIKLWHVGAVIVALDVLGLFGANSGGSLAHLGGSLLGYAYAQQLLKGNDIGKGFESMADTVSGWFKSSKKGPLKTVHKNKSKIGGYSKSDFNAFNNQKKIDVILDKISKSGYESLTAEEKEFLFRAEK